MNECMNECARGGRGRRRADDRTRKPLAKRCRSRHARTLTHTHARARAHARSHTGRRVGSVRRRIGQVLDPNQTREYWVELEKARPCSILRPPHSRHFAFPPPLFPETTTSGREHDVGDCPWRCCGRDQAADGRCGATLARRMPRRGRRRRRLHAPSSTRPPLVRTPAALTQRQRCTHGKCTAAVVRVCGFAARGKIAIRRTCSAAASAQSAQLQSALGARIRMRGLLRETGRPSPVEGVDRATKPARDLPSFAR
jgi:hypothetical protein